MALRRLACLASSVMAITGCNSPAPEILREIAVPVKVYEIDKPLGTIRGIGVERSGDVWVLSSAQPFLHRFSSTGDHLRSFDLAMTYPWSIVVEDEEGGSVIHIWDVGAREIVTLNVDGTVVSRARVLLSSHPVARGVEEIAFGTPRKLERYGNGFILQDEQTSVALPIHLAYSRLLNVDLTGSVSNVVVDFARRYTETADDLDGIRALVPVPLWTVCGDSVVVFDPYRSLVEVFSPDGSLGSSFEVPLRQQEITEADIDRWTRHWLQWEARQRGKVPSEFRLRKLIDQRLIYRGQFAKFAPAFVSMLCAEDGGLWLQQFSTRHHPAGFGQVWLVFRNGRLTDRVRFAFGFQPLRVSGQYILGAQADSSGMGFRLGLALTNANDKSSQ